MAEILKKSYRYVLDGGWALLILLLPFTSLPLMAKLAHSDMVAAPSGLPMLLLVVLFLIPFAYKRGSFPALVKPLAAFALVAVLASALAWFRDVPVFKERGLLSREVQSFFTLLVGLGFYLVTAAWLKDIERRRFTFKLINSAGLVIILWCGVQAFFWYAYNGTPRWLGNLQESLTMRQFFVARVNGFALEPSWLAHQLNMLFLPYWLAATSMRYSAWRWRLAGISAENLLLGGGAAALFLSFSRVGLLAFMLALAWLILRANMALARRIYSWIEQRRKSQSAKRLVKSGVYAGLLVIFILVTLAGAAGVVFAASKFDDRVARLFETPRDFVFSIEYANQLAFAERMIYWSTGWEIFNDYPLTGVGLGAAGYYFPSEMPAFGWYLPEIRDLLYRAGYLPNTKSLWSRLLAETGTAGFAFFAVWMLLLWQGASFLRRRKDLEERTIGLMGGLVLTAMLVEGFSVDSFALPYWWISLGILTAAAGRALIKSQNNVELPQERGREL